MFGPGGVIGDDVRFLWCDFSYVVNFGSSLPSFGVCICTLAVEASFTTQYVQSNI